MMLSFLFLHQIASVVIPFHVSIDEKNIISQKSHEMIISTQQKKPCSSVLKRRDAKALHHVGYTFSLKEVSQLSGMMAMHEEGLDSSR